MAIDFLSEQRLTARDATVYFPPWRVGKPTHVSRVIRAITQGTVGPDGARHFLEAANVNGQWITTREAVQRFLETLSPRRPESLLPPLPPAEGRGEGQRSATASGNSPSP